MTVKKNSSGAATLHSTQEGPFPSVFHYNRFLNLDVFEKAESKTDTDFRAATVHRLPSVQSTRLSNSGNRTFTEVDMDDEVKAWFPCPFCYVEIELPLLCVHLQEEHCFDMKNAVCPICAANLGKHPLGHFMMQHAHSIKRRKKSHKSGLWNNVPGNIVKDLGDLSSFLSANSSTRQGSGNEPPNDPLLSPFLCNVPLIAPKGCQEHASSCVLATSDDESSSLSHSVEVSEQDYEGKMQQSSFIRELLLSTIF